jgi:TatA/E family protein of Tat protein translocase
MFDLSVPKLLVLAVIALVIFGPDKLPTIASQVGRALRDLRKIAEAAKNDLREGLGPEFADIEIEDLKSQAARAEAPLRRPERGPASPAAAGAPGRAERHAPHAGRAPAVRPERDLSRPILVPVEQLPESAWPGFPSGVA